MPTGYVEFYSILVTRREYSALEKRYRQPISSLDHFEYAAFDRVVKKLIKKGWYKGVDYEKARGMLNNSLAEWFERIDKGYGFEKK
jgi:hypothetical protein